MSGTDVFVAGRGDYHTYRIPALVETRERTLLAFCEGRRERHADAGDIDLLVRRSTNHGRYWSPPEVVWSDSTNTCGNPCPVVDHTTGAIHLLTTWNRGSDTESLIVRSLSGDVRHPYLLSSTDDGVTWSRPRRISTTARRRHWQWYATGPGNGIQLQHGTHAGRLLVPANHSNANAPIHDDQHHHSHLLYSDDHGASWHIGAVQPPRTNESAIAEASDGAVLQAMRNRIGNVNRALSLNRDGGSTPGLIWLAPELETPYCQGSLVRDDTREVLHFSSPRGEHRSHLTIWTSSDNGTTWPHSRLVDAGPTQYSSLSVLADGRLAILYERGDPCHSLRFAILDIPNA